MYTNPLSSIIQSHRGIKHHFYADDTQLAANKLKLNPDKTEFILIGSRYSRKQLHSLFPTDILGNKVAPASNVKNLGVVFDPNLTLTDHISKVIKSTRALYVILSFSLQLQYGSCNGKLITLS